MSAMPKAVSTTTAPDWMVAEMPAGYQTRFAEIQRLSAEMHSMDRMARLLWETGAPLHEAVREIFAALKCEVDALPGGMPGLAVKLDARRRLLVYVSGAESAIEKKNPELASVFHIVHEIAGGEDRAVIVTNTDRAAPPKSRPAPVSTEAATLLGRLGANVLPAATLFALWTMSMQDPQRARTYLERLHAQDGGVAAAV
jgi:hypothetical protein